MKPVLLVLSLIVCSSAFVSEPSPDNVPIAIHQLVVVETAQDSVIRLKSFDENSFDVSSSNHTNPLAFIRFTLIIHMRIVDDLYSGCTAHDGLAVSTLTSF